MGYYADGNGSITFTKLLNSTQCETVNRILSEAFECYQCDIDNSTSFCFWNSEKYYREAVESALADVAEVAEIEKGEIEYIGEDKSIWRYVYMPNDPTSTTRRGRWIEQAGRIVYN